MMRITASCMARGLTRGAGYSATPVRPQYNSKKSSPPAAFRASSVATWLYSNCARCSAMTANDRRS